MQRQHADRPARRHGRVSPARHHGSRAAPIPRHSRQSYRKDCQLLPKSQGGIWIQRRKLCHLSYQGQPDAAGRRGNHIAWQKFNLGLEAGSKPELHAVIAVQCQSDSLIICNGYKDESYIELALLAQKMGKRIFIVVENSTSSISLPRLPKTQRKTQYRNTYQVGLIRLWQVG